MTDDAPIAYMERTRAYYLALGYANPYRWAHFTDVPFVRLAKPLSAARVAIITTAAPHRPDLGDQGPGAPYNASAKFYAVYSLPISGPIDLRISHVTYDRTHTTADDPATWLPLAALKEAAASGRIGEVAPRLHGLPTNRSVATTIDVDAPDLVARCRADGVDAAALVPNCPVCHQSCSIAARALEAAGIATVVMGCARDIVEHCGVPRFLFSDFPLGNACGRPHDRASQRDTLRLALDLLEQATAPRTTVRSPLRWTASGTDWKRDYLAIDHLAPDEIARRRAENDRARDAAKSVRSADMAR
ncbi:MAG: glycine reductase [Hyphomicrobiales bacterium]|nr:glycine reductase [Hyphomicrobiales bacterium]